MGLIGPGVKIATTLKINANHYMSVDMFDKHGNSVMTLDNFGANTVVRFKRLPEGVRISEIDVVKAVCNKDNDGAGWTIRNLYEKSPELMQEIHVDSISSKFSGRGQQNTTLLTFKGVLKLIMALPGVNAREMRIKFVSVLQRYFPNDITRAECCLDVVPTIAQPLNTTAIKDDEQDQHGNLIMPLASIGLNNTVRFVRTEEGVRFSMVDIVRAVTGKNGHYCNEIIRGLSSEVQEEVGGKNALLQFKGPGQKATSLITFKGVLKLIMALPGVNAREMRTKFASVLQRYFAGDPTLVSELMENNASDAGVNQLAREDAGVAQVVSEARVKELYDEMYQKQLADFRAQRRLKLYDDRVEHQRKLELMDKEVEIYKTKATAAEKEMDVLHLQKELKNTEKAPCVVSVSRVADQVLPVDTMSEAFRDRVLVRAGNYAVQHLPAERNKIMSLFGCLENWYEDKYYDKVAGFVQKAYQDVQATWEVPKERPAERSITTYFTKHT